MNFKILQELQKHDDKHANYDCNKSIQFFHQIIAKKTISFQLKQRRKKAKNSG